LTDRSVAILRALGAWARVPEAAVAPLRRMQVLNGPSRYAMQFGAVSAADGPVGRLVPNQWLRRALHEVVPEQTGAVVMPERSVTTVQARGDAALAALSNGQVLRTRLVVAADTRRSCQPARLRAAPDGLPGDARCPTTRPRPRGLSMAAPSSRCR